MNLWITPGQSLLVVRAAQVGRDGWSLPFVDRHNHGYPQSCYRFPAGKHLVVKAGRLC